MCSLNLLLFCFSCFSDELNNFNPLPTHIIFNIGSWVHTVVNILFVMKFNRANNMFAYKITFLIFVSVWNIRLNLHTNIENNFRWMFWINWFFIFFNFFFLLDKLINIVFELFSSFGNFLQFTISTRSTLHSRTIQ